MKRAVIVVLLATLTGMVSGVDAARGGAQPPNADAREAHRERIARRLSDIPLKTVVRIALINGTRVDAVLEEVMPDAITITVLTSDRTQGDRRRFPIESIEQIERLRGRTLRNVLIGVGIAVTVLVGTCAVALNSDTSAPVTITEPQTPADDATFRDGVAASDVEFDVIPF